MGASAVRAPWARRRPPTPPDIPLPRVPWVGCVGGVSRTPRVPLGPADPPIPLAHATRRKGISGKGVCVWFVRFFYQASKQATFVRD